MSFATSVINAIAPHQTDPVPAVFRLEARLSEVESGLGALSEAQRQASFLYEMNPTDQTADALAVAQTELASAQNRVVSLQAALQVAQERSAVEVAAEAKRQHVQQVKALAVRLTSMKRHAKALSAHLNNANSAWTALVAEAIEVVGVWPKASRQKMPHLELVSLSNLQQLVRTEIARIVCAANPTGFSDIRQNGTHLLGVRDGHDGHIPGHRRTGGADSLPSLEQRVVQGAESLLAVARASAPPTLNPVSYAAPRLKAAVWEPGIIENSERPAALVERPTSDLNVGFEPTPTAADVVWNNVPGASKPPAWDASDLSAQVAEYRRLHPTPAPDPSTYTDETETLSSLDELTAPELKDIEP